MILAQNWPKKAKTSSQCPFNLTLIIKLVADSHHLLKVTITVLWPHQTTQSVGSAYLNLGFMSVS